MGNKIIYYCDKCNTILNSIKEIKIVSTDDEVLELCDKCYKETVYKTIPKEAKIKKNTKKKNYWYKPKGIYKKKIPAEDLQGEVWKPVKDFEGIYSVSNKGRVKSLKKNIILNQGNITRGYLGVSLAKDGIHYSKRVHKLVAEAFIPNLENKPQINHKNGNKKDNKVENLEWCTNTENMQHASKNKLLKLTPQKIFCLENGKIYRNIKQIAKDFNVDVAQVKNACDNPNNTLKKNHIAYL